MSIFKTPTKLVILIFFAFLLVVFFIVQSSKRKVIDYSNIEFRAIVIKITEEYRGRYDLEVKTNLNKQLIITDDVFYKYRDSIIVGDSVIKLKNSPCFNFVRKNKVLVQNCENIYLLEF